MHSHNETRNDILDALRHDALLLERMRRGEDDGPESHELPTEPCSSPVPAGPEHPWEPEGTLEPVRSRWIAPPQQHRTVKPVLSAAELAAFTTLALFTAISLAALPLTSLAAVGS